jgi:hypothetical protein
LVLAEVEEPEPVPDVPAAVEVPEVADSGRRGLKRKFGEGPQHPIAMKARSGDPSDSVKKSLNEEKKSLVKLGMENMKGNNVGHNDMIIRIK